MSAEQAGPASPACTLDLAGRWFGSILAGLASKACLGLICVSDCCSSWVTTLPKLHPAVRCSHFPRLLSMAALIHLACQVSSPASLALG